MMHEPPTDRSAQVISIWRGRAPTESLPHSKPNGVNSFREFVEAVRAKSDIAAVIGADVDLKPCGSVLKGLSPFNSERTPSFVVYADSQRFVDFSGGTQRAGDVFDYVMECCSLSFKDAVYRLAEQFGVPRPYQDAATAKRELDELHERRDVERALALAADYYHRALSAERRERWYTKHYGFTDETIDKLQLGWADGGLFTHLIGEVGLSREQALKSGLFIQVGGRVHDFFRNRLVFPYWRGGRVVYFIARRTDETSSDAWEEAKYKKLLTHSDKHSYVSKTVRNEYFYNEDAARNARVLLITEGVTDCISAMQADVKCISPVTTRFSKRDEPKLRELVGTSGQVVICNDAEDSGAGEAGAIATAKVLLNDGCDVRIATLSRAAGVSKIDVNELVRDQGSAALERVVNAAKPFAEFLLDQIPYHVNGADLDRALEPVFEAMTKVSDIEREGLTALIVKRHQIGRRVIARRIKEIAAHERANARAESTFPDIRCNGRQTREIVLEVLSELIPLNLQRVERAQLSEHPLPLFRTAAGLSMLRAEDGRAPRLELCTEAGMYGVLARSMDWHKVNADGQARICPPPTDVVRDVLHARPEGIPALEGVITTPFFDASATLVQKPGYHESARAWLHLDPSLRLREVALCPSQDEVRAALELFFEELLFDFPFASQADRAHVLAFMLLPFIRLMIAGGTPLFLIEAAAIAAGKTLLVQLANHLAAGRAGGMAILPPDEEEVQKTLTSELLQASPYIAFDNIRERKIVDSVALATVLTSDEWRARLLGRNEVITLPNRATWVITGNNVQLSPELTRRSVRIRLNPNVDRAWRRTGFKHDPIKAWASDNRAELVHAALTLVQAWVAAGKPAGTARLGSFESWAAVTGGILDVIGVKGFLDNADELYADADRETEAWRVFTQVWWSLFETSDVQVAMLNDICEQRGLLEEERKDASSHSSTHSQVTRLGRALQSKRDQVFGELRIRVSRDDRRGRRYSLERVTADSPRDSEVPNAGLVAAEVPPLQVPERTQEVDPWAEV
jgi:DNA primase catalytic core